MMIVLNIGLTDKDNHEVEYDSYIVEEYIGKNFDCTITKTLGYYKGERENSLKVELYEIEKEKAIKLCKVINTLINQECIALKQDNNEVEFISDRL